MKAAANGVSVKKRKEEGEKERDPVVMVVTEGGEGEREWESAKQLFVHGKTLLLLLL